MQEIYLIFILIIHVLTSLKLAHELKVLVVTTPKYKQLVLLV